MFSGRLSTGSRQIANRFTALVSAAAALLLSTDVRAEDAVSKVVFTCRNGKTIDATFYAGAKVELTLSDGRSMSLPQTMSGSGIRYADADESFVFWSKGNTAFVTEGVDEKETFSDCISK